MKHCDGHTHPNLLKSENGGLDFVNAAIRNGFDEIVFTDHMPFTVTGDEHDRIPFGAVEDYCRAVTALSKQFANDIKISVGIEVDFHPTCISEIRDVLSAGRFDRVLGSSHLNISGFGIPFQQLTNTEFASIVIENYIAAAESGFFDVITHLDIYRLLFADDTFPMRDDGFSVSSVEHLLRRLFSCLERSKTALELNAAPLYKCFDNLGPYPTAEILRIAEDYRFSIVYGSDAHIHTNVGFGYDSCKAFLR